MADSEAFELLQRAEYGFLGMLCGNEPYQVPLSFVLDGETLYFHCAAQGKKLECLRSNPTVSFAAVGATQPVYDKGYSTYYESVLVSGQARELTDDQEKLRALCLLTEKYLAEHMEHFMHEVDRYRKVTQVWAVRIGTISGKAKRRPCS